jgi:flagellar hook protein FlgE
MTFRIALSGLNAATADLNVTANNIANVNTPGFKRSRAEFSDLFAVSPYGLAHNEIGAGVKVSRVSQQFAQGNIDFTDNSLDMAISGEGFFTLSRNGAHVYSRAGNFSVDRDGYVVNNSGDRLQAFPTATGTPGAPPTFNTGALGDLRLSIADAPPSPTANVTVGTNLPANATAPTVTPFSATNAQSYNQSTSISVYDSLGVEHTATFYYVKTANPNEWQMYATVDGTAVGGANTLQYDASGKLTAPAGGTLAPGAFTPTNGASPMNLTLDLSSSTQFGSSFSVNRLTQDGYATGQLSGVDVSDEGVVMARYTNGQAVALGQVALTNFSNPQGLQQLGDTAWAETYDSGQPLLGAAGTSAFGKVQSGALEASNVDLTEQLVNMITAQRDFQANAQMISTADQVTQTIINIR